MKVPLEISVEIGRTKKLVKDILEFTQGSLVVLDKMAGEQADLYVNGQCIAKGDIVVVEDNFGIRITEIVARNLIPEGTAGSGVRASAGILLQPRPGKDLGPQLQGQYAPDCRAASDWG